MMKQALVGVVVSVGMLAGVASARKVMPPPPAAAPSGASAELKVGTGITKRTVTGEATSFPKGTTIYVWSRLHDVDGSVTHVWKHDGKETWTKDLPVGSHAWSTFSRRTIQSPGAWQVEVKTADGTSLGTIDFTVE